jgi:hypothetical protein
MLYTPEIESPKVNRDYVYRIFSCVNSAADAKSLLENVFVCPVPEA